MIGDCEILCETFQHSVRKRTGQPFCLGLPVLRSVLVWGWVVACLSLSAVGFPKILVFVFEKAKACIWPEPLVTPKSSLQASFSGDMHSRRCCRTSSGSWRRSGGASSRRKRRRPPAGCRSRSTRLRWTSRMRRRGRSTRSPSSIPASPPRSSSA